LNRTLFALRKVTTRLREIPGAVLFMEPFRTRLLVRDRTVVVPDFDGCLSLELSLGGHMGSQIFWYGSYSRHILRVMDALLEPGMVVVDVGANLGEITLVAARRVGASGRVLAFEPVDEIADRLDRNVAMNDLFQVTVCRVGLSDHVGTADLYTSRRPFHDRTHHEGLSSLYADEERDSPVQTIALTTLDAVRAEQALERLDLLKIDVEGAELEVLRGARETIAATQPWIIVEVNRGTSRNANVRPEDILGLLAEQGYRFYRIDRRQPLTELTAGSLRRFENVLAKPPGRTARVLSPAEALPRAHDPPDHGRGGAPR
jgi:FkbM family methyltransferase